MRTLKQHIDIVTNAMNAVNAIQKQDDIIVATNICMNTLAGIIPLGAMMDNITLTSGDAAWLPDNMAGITKVVDSDGAIVWERGEGSARSAEEVYRYFEEIVRAPSATDTLPFESTGSIIANQTELTCADLYAISTTESIVGLTVRIVNEDNGEYYYKIAAINDNNTIELDMNHPYTEDDSVVTVLRNYSKRLGVVDSSGEAADGEEFTVYYWTFPNPLTQNSDIIPLVYPDVLELMTIRRIPETKDRRPVSQAQIDKAIAMAKRKEPDQSSPARPTSQQGSPLVMGQATSTAYTNRGE